MSMIDTNLKSQVAIVTGGSQGIGAATAFTLGQAGASVALTYNRSESMALEVVDKIEKLGSKALALPLDLQDKESIDAMVYRTMEFLKSAGLWLVGAEGGTDRNWDQFDYREPLGLVLGSEGKGLRPLVRSKCDAVLSLPLAGRIASLNVAAAAAVFMYEVVRQRRRAEDPTKTIP